MQVSSFELTWLQVCCAVQRLLAAHEQVAVPLQAAGMAAHA